VNAIRGDIASLAGTMVGVRAELGEVKTSVKAEVRIVEEKVGNLRWYIGAVVTVAAIALSVVMHFVK
jgi:hypothetical protein